MVVFFDRFISEAERISCVCGYLIKLWMRPIPQKAGDNNRNLEQNPLFHGLQNRPPPKSGKADTISFDFSIYYVVYTGSSLSNIFVTLPTFSFFTL